MTLARSSHGTLISYQQTPGGAFTEIAELGDLALPGTDREEFNATVHNRKTDDWVLSGIMTREPLTFPMNFLPGNATHDHLTGLYYHHINKIFSGYRVVIPVDPTTLDPGITWVMSGQVKAIKPAAPVQGKLSADVTIRFSGLMTIGGVTIGL
jgi:hypothetical protein